MSKNILRTIGLLSIAGTLLAPAETKAFGLRSHIYIGEQVLKDAEDCKLDLAGTEQEIPEEVCTALKEHPGAFLAGNIGPDIFPDIVIGQSYIHPGAEDGRKSADWFEIILQSARTKEEIAFAYGNLVHAAGDIFAHSYVNNYSGGIFEILASRDKDIEKRHFQLEKYIDQRLDPSLDSRTELTVPAGFVVDTLIKTSYFSGNYTFDQGTLTDVLLNPGDAAADEFFKKLSSAKAASHAVLMYSVLALAEANSRTLPCEAAKAEVNMINAYRRYLIAEANARSTSGVETVSLDLPPQVSYQCDATGEASFTDTMLKELGDELNAQVQQSQFFEVASAAVDERKSFWRSLPSGPRDELSSAYRAYERAVEERNEKRALAVFAKDWVSDVRLASEEYILAGLGTSQLMLQNSLPHPPVLHDRKSGAFYYSLWAECYLPVYFGQPIEAARAKCERLSAMDNSLDLADAAGRAGMGRVPRNFVYRVIDFKRRVDAFFMRLAKAAGRMVAPQTAELLEEIYEPSRITREKLNETFRKGGRSGFLKLRGTPKILRFQCATDWIDVDLGLIEPQNDDAVWDDEICREIDDVDRKSFLEPDKFVPFVHAITLGKTALLDRQGVKDLSVKMLRRASLEGKVSADDLEQLAEMNLSSPINWTASDGQRGQRYSVIVDTPINIDGSYQWQGLSMPYPKRGGVDAKKVKQAQVSAGYPLKPSIVTTTIPGSGVSLTRTGFPFYQSRALREHVFSQLFPVPFEGAILRRAEMQGQLYPFRPCEGDPFRPYTSGEQEKLCRTSKRED